MSTVHHLMTMEQARLAELLRAPPGLFVENNMMATEQDNAEDEEHILLRPMTCSYDTLFEMMRVADFDPSAPIPRNLPPELVTRVLSFLTVKRVKKEEVCATNCSSHDGIHPLSFCLTDSEDSWWLAESGTMPSGRGAQWVQFQMNKDSGLRRLSAVSIKIPPMPQGPLSVREFTLQAFHLERGWHSVTPIFQVDNKAGWQKYRFEDVDADEIRLVCLSNQMEQYLINLRKNNPEDQDLLSQLRRFESVGFFSVSFE